MKNPKTILIGSGSEGRNFATTLAIGHQLDFPSIPSKLRGWDGTPIEVRIFQPPADFLSRVLGIAPVEENETFAVKPPKDKNR